MKKLSKKQWGIFGTSIGSILIIVALLTMVGIGSGDTYAASVVQCTCPEGYDKIGNRCEKKIEKLVYYTCTTGGTAIRVCPADISNCQYQGNNRYQCSEYEYTTLDETTCTCPSGTELDGAGGCVPKSCPAGQYYNNGECAACPKDSYCPGDKKKYLCPANAICTSVSFTCNPGYGKNAAEASCESCPTGQYSSNGICLSCPANAECTPDSFTCIKPYEKNLAGTACVLNEHCDAGSYKTFGGYCEICPAGSFCPNESSSPQQCPAGKYCPAGSGAPQECPKNATCSDDGTTFTCIKPYEKNQAGTACILNEHCAAGSYKTTWGYCVICPAGSFCPQDTDSPQQCEEDTYCPEGSSSPKECPKNATCPANSSAFKCTGNYVKSSNGTYCYNPDTGTSSDKTICPAGTYYNGNKKCVSCEAGYTCPQTQIVYENNSAAGLGRTICGSGTYCLGGNLSPTKCEAGTYCPEGSSSPKKCPANAMCPEGTSTFTCNKADGYVMNSTKTGCVKTGTGPIPGKTTCKAGTYYDGSNSCLPCTSGFYCPGGIFSHQTGDINGSGRKTCPANATCPANSFTFDCIGNYIKNSNGTYCYNPDTGTSSDKTICPAGTYYNGNKKCVSCEAGYTCPQTQIVYSNDNNAGSGRTLCANGTYCLGGTSNPERCPSDKPYSDIGAKSEGDCKTIEYSNGGGGSSNTPSGGNNSGMGGNQGSNSGNSNINKNPYTTTKTPLIIATIGIISISIGTLTYFKSKKETNPKI